MGNFTWIILAFGVLIVLKLVMGSSASSGKSKKPEKQQKQFAAFQDEFFAGKTELITPAEARAMAYLISRLSSHAHVCPNVRLQDVVSVDKSRTPKERQSAATKRIDRKHLDFVIIRHSGEILFALEVDDSSHRRRDRQHADSVKNDVMRDAGIKLIRVEPDHFEDNVELQQAIASIVPPDPVTTT